MSFSDRIQTPTEVGHSHTPATVAAGTVLVREAGLPFQPPMGAAHGVDPFVEWLSLMEVVQLLCPRWPVRDKPMLGAGWKL